MLKGFSAPLLPLSRGAQANAATAVAEERAAQEAQAGAALQAQLKRMEASVNELNARLADTKGSHSDQLARTTARMREAHDKDVAALKAQLAAEAAKQDEAQQAWAAERAGLDADLRVLDAEATRLNHVDAALKEANETITALEQELAETVRANTLCAPSASAHAHTGASGDVCGRAGADRRRSWRPWRRRVSRRRPASMTFRPSLPPIASRSASGTALGVRARRRALRPY